MNYGLIGAAYAALHATHGIADYWFQTDWQAQNKSNLGWLAGLGLLATLYGSLGALLAWLVERQPGMRR